MLLALFVVGGTLNTSTICLGQSDGGPAAENKEIVRYRLTKWKSVHTGKETDAKKMVATLKQLKCEYKMHQHGDHIDVIYRCPAWKQLSLKDHKTAHQWEAWLKKYGFETQHIH
jgi:hypothetical protein